MNKVISIVLLQRAYFPHVWRQRFSLLLVLSLLAVSEAGHATVISGSSSSYGLSADIDVTLLNVLGPPTIVNVSAGPAPTSSGTAPAPYGDSDSLVSLSAGLPGVLGVSTDLLQTSAVSGIDGAPGSSYAFADASVANLAISALAQLSLSAELIRSATGVSGDHGTLVASGGTTLVNAAISGPLGSIALDVFPAPNTVVNVATLGLVGVSLILNEQIETGDGINSRGRAVNAIHLTLDGFVSGLISLTGDIIISHSEAHMQAQPNEPVQVPEPTTLALMSLGFAALNWRSRRKEADYLA